MRVIVVTLAVFTVCCLGAVGCSKKGFELDTNSTIRYDPARDGEPKDIGPSKGGKGKKGAGSAAPP